MAPDPTTLTDYRIVAPEPAHRDGWQRLYDGYARFYRVPMDDTIAGRLWAWLLDPGHITEGLLAVDAGGEPIGLAHFRAMPRPLQARYAGFLDDLFVDPAQRGSPVAQGLLDRLAEIGRERDWSTIRWITADDNYRARGLYDRVAKRTGWITYEIRLD